MQCDVADYINTCLEEITNQIYLEEKDEQEYQSKEDSWLQFIWLYGNTLVRKSGVFVNFSQFTKNNFQFEKFWYLSKFLSKLDILDYIGED